MSVGKVWLVGAGPGDPNLITVRGLEVLSQADVVLHDALAHKALLENCPYAELHSVGKRYGEDSTAQALINEKLILLAREGKRVVRLKGGDPFLFARGAEEALALAEAGIPFEVVPGVTSPIAAAAYAGISLTHRDLSSSVTFITGSDRAGKAWSPDSWHRLATATDTLCVFMGMRRIEEITQALLDGGRAASTPAAVVQWGGRPEQQVVVATLGTIASIVRQKGLTNPAIIIVGEVVNLRQKMRWYDHRPLFGKRVLLPRPIEQGRASARAIRERGAEVLLVPLIEIRDAPNPARVEKAINELSTYDWVLFTSANGVERFFAALHRKGRDARAFGDAKVGVIGPKTEAALEHYGVFANAVATEFVGEGMARAVLERGVPKKVLLARAAVAREILPDILRHAGATVDVVATYETRPAEFPPGESPTELLAAGQVDVIMFTSSSTVHSLLDHLGEAAKEALRTTTIASIGPITTKALTSRGVQPHITADIYTLEGLLDAMEGYYGGNSSIHEQ